MSYEFFEFAMSITSCSNGCGRRLRSGRCVGWQLIGRPRSGSRMGTLCVCDMFSPSPVPVPLCPSLDVHLDRSRRHVANHCATPTPSPSSSPSPTPTASPSPSPSPTGTGTSTGCTRGRVAGVSGVVRVARSTRLAVALCCRCFSRGRGALDANEIFTG